MLLVFEQATPADLPVVLDLLDEAAAWLRQRNIEQWPDRFGGVDDWRAARIAEYVTTGQTWLVRLGGEAVATFSLGGADPDYADGWPDGPDDALYIFRTAVRRAWAGRDIGGRILNWASARAHTQGCRWLRLDCHRNNTALQRYYENRGFLRVGTLVRTITDGPTPGTGNPYTRGSGALYQRPAGSVHFPCQKETIMTDRYDPTGEAAIWEKAAALVNSLKHDQIPGDDLNLWNTALDQAARALDNESRAIRQRDGMYYRVITGQEGYQPLTDAG